MSVWSWVAASLVGYIALGVVTMWVGAWINPDVVDADELELALVAFWPLVWVIALVWFPVLGVHKVAEWVARATPRHGK